MLASAFQYNSCFLYFLVLPVNILTDDVSWEIPSDMTMQRPNWSNDTFCPFTKCLKNGNLGGNGSFWGKKSETGTDFNASNHQGDSKNGQDELEPNRSYLNHIPTLYMQNLEKKFP